VESCIEFSQREKDFVAIRCSGDYAQRHVRAPQFLAQRRSGPLENFLNRHPIIDGLLPLSSLMLSVVRGIAANRPP
jgi:hypothetical protein